MPLFPVFFGLSSTTRSVSLSNIVPGPLNRKQGILFLTTNRIGAFDPAFKSRIHLSLYYPRLNERTTKKIWRMHIKRTRKLFKKQNKPLKIERDAIVGFAITHYRELSEDPEIGCWNGRQIRNAFQTAVALAEYKAQREDKVPVLTEEQFEDVAVASREFDQYLRLTFGASEQDRAKRNHIRADEYDLKREKEKKASRPSRREVATESSRRDQGTRSRRMKADLESETETSEASSGGRATKNNRKSRSNRGRSGTERKEANRGHADGDSDSSDTVSSDSDAKDTQSKSAPKEKERRAKMSNKEQ